MKTNESNDSLNLNFDKAFKNNLVKKTIDVPNRHSNLSNHRSLLD